MLPERPRGPMPLFPSRRPQQWRQMSQGSNLLSQFRNPDGNFNIEKISQTAQQIGAIYSQVSPMITKFTKK